jgi:hypothetical protein
LRMRISVTLDDDVYELVSFYASARGITLGGAIGELVRKSQSVREAPPEIHRSKSGLAMFPPTGNVVTAELVKRLENEE